MTGTEETIIGKISDKPFINLISKFKL